MKVEVLGSGCRKCSHTADAVREVAQALDLEVEVDKVTDPEALLRYQVLSTPAVVVDGRLVHSGSVPDRSRIEQWLAGAAGQ